MKRKILFLAAIIALSLCVLPACQLPADSSIKSITKPYIAQYECMEARLGDIDILEKYDYIRIILKNKDEMEIVYKPKDGQKTVIEGTYKVDAQTRELEGQIGILDNTIKEKVKVEKGGFVISKIIAEKELFMKFQMK